MTEFQSKMWCIDAQEEVSVRGSYDTEEGRIIKVLLEKCDQYTVRDDLECKSEEEIEEYFSDKYFLLLITNFIFLFRYIFLIGI